MSCVVLYTRVRQEVSDAVPASVPLPADLCAALISMQVALTIGTIVLGLWIFSQLSSNNRWVTCDCLMAPPCSKVAWCKRNLNLLNGASLLARK